MEIEEILTYKNDIRKIVIHMNSKRAAKQYEVKVITLIGFRSTQKLVSRKMRTATL